MQLYRAPVQGTLLPARREAIFKKVSVVARANGDDKSKVVREYREDSGEVVVPGEQKKADNALYADQVPPQVKGRDWMARYTCCLVGLRGHGSAWPVLWQHTAT